MFDNIIYKLYIVDIVEREEIIGSSETEDESFSDGLNESNRK